MQRLQSPAEAELEVEGKNNVTKEGDDEVMRAIGVTEDIHAVSFPPRMPSFSGKPR